MVTFVVDREGNPLMPTHNIKGKSPVILRAHHVYYWKGDHTDRLSGLITLCTKCHTPANHKEGKPLYGWDPSQVKSMSGAAFMNQVRWALYHELKALCDVEGVSIHITYGAATKRERHSRRIIKNHANDAYCMGHMRPKHKAEEQHFRKHRRNERALTKFYDAKIEDIRTKTTWRAQHNDMPAVWYGKKKPKPAMPDAKKGDELGSVRTNRSEARNEGSLRKYRGYRISPGRVLIRKTRSPIPSGSIVRYDGRKYITAGTQHYGEYTTLKGHDSVKCSEVKVVRYAGAWTPVCK